MNTLVILLSTALLGTAACRERTTSLDDDRMQMTKPVESAPGARDSDDDFIQTRATFETTTRERLNRADIRIDELESATDAAGHDVANRLRARRDELASRLNAIGDQTESGWDRFESEMSGAMNELEREVDMLVD